MLRISDMHYGTSAGVVAIEYSLDGKRWLKHELPDTFGLMEVDFALRNHWAHQTRDACATEELGQTAQAQGDGPLRPPRLVTERSHDPQRESPSYRAACADAGRKP